MSDARHTCSAWPTDAIPVAWGGAKTIVIERAGDSSWQIDVNCGEFGWTIHFCPFCGLNLDAATADLSVSVDLVDE
jgi:hypothetical protein